MNALSGGERSHVTLSLLLAPPGERLETPCRAIMDEFDVFLDTIMSRQIALPGNLGAEHCQRGSQQQQKLNGSSEDSTLAISSAQIVVTDYRVEVRVHHKHRTANANKSYQRVD